MKLSALFMLIVLSISSDAQEINDSLWIFSKDSTSAILNANFNEQRQTLQATFTMEGLDLKARKALIEDFSIFDRSYSADSLALEALSESTVLADPQRRGWAHYIHTKMLLFRHDYDEALVHNNLAREAFNETTDANGVLQCDLVIGDVYSFRGEMSDAAIAMTQVLRQSRELKDTTVELRALSVLGSIHGMQKNYTGALRNFQEILELAMVTNNVEWQYTSHYHLAEFWHRMEQLDTARHELRLSEEIMQSCCPEDSAHLCRLNYLRSTIAADAGNIQFAVDNLAPWQTWQLRNKMWPWAAFIHAIRAGWLLKLNRRTEALSLAQAGYDIAREHNLMKESMDNLLVLHEAHKAMGQFELAYSTLDEFHRLKDSIITRQGIDQMATLEQRFQYERQQLADSLQYQKERFQLELARENVERSRNIYLLIGLGVLLLAAALYHRLRFTRRAKRTIEQEKRISEDLLLNILPNKVAEELKEKGEAEAQLIDQVTVLFTDFKGFTAMSEQLSPRELVNDLNICFSEFDRIVQKFNIEKIKTIGDAYMAAGGLPIPNDTHAVDVIRAAFEMRDFVEAGRAKKIDAGLPYFEIRIGIHTGPVVAGIVGVKKFQYDIWGDTVNTASRMESSGEVGKVNVSGSTYGLVKENSKFKFTSRGKVEAKGKGKMEMWFVSKA